MAVFGARDGAGCSTVALGLADLLRRRGWDAALISGYSSGSQGPSFTAQNCLHDPKQRVSAAEPNEVGPVSERQSLLTGIPSANFSESVIRVLDAGTIPPADVEPRLRDGRILLVAPADAPGLMRAYAWLKTARKVGALARTAVVFNGVSEAMPLAEAAARLRTATRRFLDVEIPVWAGLPRVAEEMPLPTQPGVGILPVDQGETAAAQPAGTSAAAEWLRGLNDVVDHLFDVWTAWDAGDASERGEGASGLLTPPHADAA
ncbi:MAG: hypothetical protein GYA33_09105 [Thermogutta sp.]|nr:hypothetical protein [Thermogutta sp.]